MNILVTGGAGYIGSHFIRAALNVGHAVSVIDDLSTGYRDSAPPEIAFLHADIADRVAVLRVMRSHGIEAVVHFAARSQVTESVVDPLLYYRANVAGSIALFDAAVHAGIRRLVLSSSAAVYGASRVTPISENIDTVTISPYGETKLVVERALAHYGRAYGIRWAALRYFNVAGAAYGLSERHKPETHLIPIVLEVVRGDRSHLDVYGDGAMVRDYVHVLDVVDAHLQALDLIDGAPLGVINIGSGQGYSVNQVVETVERVTGHKVRTRSAPPRAGDPPSLVADIARATERLGWRPTRSLEQIVRDAWT